MLKSTRISGRALYCNRGPLSSVSGGEDMLIGTFQFSRRILHFLEIISSASHIEGGEKESHT
jgi:hypothetical protein